MRDEGGTNFYSSQDPSVVYRSLAASLFALLTIVAILLLARRLSGALSHPLPGGSLLLVGVVLALGAAGGRGALRVSKFQGRALSLIVLLLAAAISLQGSSPSGLAMLWVIVLSGEAWAWRPDFRRWKSAESIGSAELETELPADDVIQQHVRRREADGREFVSGSVRVTFAAGQRTATAHVAFCPPFAAMPEFSAEPWDGPSATVKVSQVLPYGARLEVKLDRESASSTSVLVAFESQLCATGAHAIKA